MDRRVFLKWMGAATGSLFVGGCRQVVAAEQAGRKEPHVLLICVDDLMPALGCYGDPLAKTPNIDQLAARGMCFDLAYCNQAVCAPSRYNLRLGSRSTSLGLYGLGKPFREVYPDAATMSQYFRRHGWRAEGIGKIFHFGHGNTGDHGFHLGDLGYWTKHTNYEQANRIPLIFSAPVWSRQGRIPISLPKPLIFIQLWRHWPDDSNRSVSPGGSILVPRWYEVSGRISRGCGLLRLSARATLSRQPGRETFWFRSVWNRCCRASKENWGEDEALWYRRTFSQTKKPDRRTRGLCRVIDPGSRQGRIRMLIRDGRPLRIGIIGRPVG